MYASLPKTFCNRRVVHSEENKKPDACGEWMVNQVFNDHLSPLEAKERGLLNWDHARGKTVCPKSRRDKIKREIFKCYRIWFDMFQIMFLFDYLSSSQVPK